MNALLDRLQSLSATQLFDIRVLLGALPVLAVLFGVSLRITRPGWKPGCLSWAVFLILVALPFGWQAAINWLSTSTDPEVVGRQPDLIAPMGTDVTIDGFSVRIDKPLGVNGCKNIIYGGSGRVCLVTVYASITCDLDPSESCPGQLNYEAYLASGERMGMGSTIVDRDPLPGGQTIALERTQSYTFREANYDGLYLVIQGPEGRTLNKHKAYLELPRR